MFVAATPIFSFHICTEEKYLHRTEIFALNNENEDENAFVRMFAVPDLDWLDEN